MVPYTDKNIRDALRAFIATSLPKSIKEEEATVNAALSQSRGAPSARKQEFSIAIAINDSSRPAIQKRILPLLLPEIMRHFTHYGMHPPQIIICIANGLHPLMTNAEITSILPEGYEKYHIVNHDADAPETMTALGTSRAGSPIWINSAFYRAAYKITISSLDGHQFVGITGGAKMAAIGLGGRQTITHNHSLYRHHNARLGEIESNPVRQDIEEIGAKIHIDMSINCVLNNTYDILGVQVFDYLQRNRSTTFTHFAHSVLKQRAIKSVGEYDCVIAAAGGAPRDNTLYQLQKALAHVAPLAKKRAPVVLCGACSQGVGDDTFQEHFTALSSIDEVITHSKSAPFKIGPHKSMLFARDMQHRSVALMSDLPKNLTARMHFTPLSLNNRVILRFLDNSGVASSGRIAIIPYAMNCYFDITS